MSDRLQEIRARLDAAWPYPWAFRSGAVRSDDIPVYIPAAGSPNSELIVNAPADIAWLLDEVERLRGER